MTTPQQIDAFLKKKGSPLAGFGNIFVGAGRKYGVDPALVVSISGIESSFGKQTFRPYNAWGWMSGKRWSSWEQGISEVTRGLSQGYIREGLTTPEQIVRKYAPASDGNDELRWAKVVNQFLGELGSSGIRGAPGPTPAGQPPRPAGSAASPMSQASALLDGSDPVAAMARDNLAEIARDGKVNAERQLSKLVGAAQQQAEATQRQTIAMQSSMVPPVPRSQGAALAPPKGALKLPREWRGTHVTDGLDWNHGSPTAIDIMGKTGQPVSVPFDGVVEQWGSAQQGEAMYLRDQTGRRYWLGHVDDRLPEGTSFRAGSVIARLSPHSNGAHAHWDVLR